MTATSVSETVLADGRHIELLRHQGRSWTDIAAELGCAVTAARRFLQAWNDHVDAMQKKNQLSLF